MEHKCCNKLIVRGVLKKVINCRLHVHNKWVPTGNKLRKYRGARERHLFIRITIENNQLASGFIIGLRPLGNWSLIIFYQLGSGEMPLLHLVEFFCFESGFQLTEDPVDHWPCKPTACDEHRSSVSILSAVSLQLSADSSIDGRRVPFVVAEDGSANDEDNVRYIAFVELMRSRQSEIYLIVSTKSQVCDRWSSTLLHDMDLIDKLYAPCRVRYCYITVTRSCSRGETDYDYFEPCNTPQVELVLPTLHLYRVIQLTGRIASAQHRLFSYRCPDAEKLDPLMYDDADLVASASLEFSKT